MPRRRRDIAPLDPTPPIDVHLDAEPDENPDGVPVLYEGDIVGMQATFELKARGQGAFFRAHAATRIISGESAEEAADRVRYFVRTQAQELAADMIEELDELRGQVDTQISRRKRIQYNSIND